MSWCGSEQGAPQPPGFSTSLTKVTLKLNGENNVLD